MNRFMCRYPSPSLVVSITALVVALGGASFSATGGNFILGRSNVATTPSALTAHLNARTLQLSNLNTGTVAAPLALFAAAGHPPFTVNSATKVANLNADRLDGLDSTAVARLLRIPFTLAAGGTSASIVLPVHLMGSGIPGNYNLGEATIFSENGSTLSGWERRVLPSKARQAVPAARWETTSSISIPSLIKARSRLR